MWTTCSNVSGHRLGTAEIESALVAHPKIAEAAVVGIPHNIKGQAINAYVTLIESLGRNRHQNCTQKSATGCVKRFARWRRQTCCTGPTPCLKPAPAKIMRRILRKIAAGDTSNLGDTSTLADPGVVEKLLEEEQAIATPS